MGSSSGAGALSSVTLPRPDERPGIEEEEAAGMAGATSRNSAGLFGQVAGLFSDDYRVPTAAPGHYCRKGDGRCG